MAYRFEFAKYNNRIEMLKFLEKLNVKDRAKIFANIYKFLELLEANSYKAGKFSKHLEDGIFELKN